MSEGWGHPWNAKTYHYFVNGISLCGRWMLFPKDPSPDDGGVIPGPEDCKLCFRKLLKRRQEASGE